MRPSTPLSFRRSRASDRAIRNLRELGILGPLLCRATWSIRIGQDEIRVARLEADEVGASVLPGEVTFDDAALDAPFPP